jgi:glycosyltransferase involved in cell wall biosynthesis
MIGSRGVPATFGGIERHVEELGSRLVARGHSVTVYCRDNYISAGQDEHRGMRLVRLPVVGRKHFDAIGHSVVSTAHAMTQQFDVLHYHALGPGLPAIVPRLAGRASVVQTVHGLDNHRAKWGRTARGVLGAAAWMSARVPHETIVVSKALAAHYLDHYGRRASYIGNGVDRPTRRDPTTIVTQLGLRPGKYVLFVGRLVPEKDPASLLEAFRRTTGDFQLAMVGGSSFTDDYVAELNLLASRDPRVVMVGYAYGELLAELYSNAAVFVLPSHVEGLPLTLLEAASYGCSIVASGIAPHREVLDGWGEDGLFAPGDVDALQQCLERALLDPGDGRKRATILQEAVFERYNWDRAASMTQEVYWDSVNQRENELARPKEVMSRQFGRYAARVPQESGGRR